mmetsp:Transcript_89187/g.158059  ORF Transcript_89187/g.158059 Transcript_89187/m.158059 type:complete len:698 (-) Transcript_89187:66-2159(-)
MVFGEEERRQLHEDGCLEIRSGLPEWEVFCLVNRFHAMYNDRVIAMLEKTRSSWTKDGDARPGTSAAWEVSQELKEEGLYVSAVHPSADDEDEYTGPRFYVSLVEHSMKNGPAPRPPKEMLELLWPEENDRLQPRITELGWTVIPPGSDMQTLHADILSYDEDDKFPRRTSLGRFHHFLWKPDGKSLCTTQVVPGGFTEGKVHYWNYDELKQVKSTSLVFDSEVLHCGSATPKDAAWGSTCTLQICSTEGWEALNSGGRASKELLWYVWPVQEETAGETGKWTVGSEVEVLWEDDCWYPARVAKYHRKDRSYRINWSGEGEGTFTAGLKEFELRAPQKKAKKRRLQEHEIQTSPPKRRAKGLQGLALGLKLSEQRSLLKTGLLLLPDGLPWRWEVFDFVEECHTRFAARIERELDALRSVWMSRSSSSNSRPGAFAAEKVSKNLARFGIAVYAGPPSQQNSSNHEVSGPRFYVSVTRRAMARFGEVPPLPLELERLLWPHAEDHGGQQRLRGLGWALAPPGSDPQQLHADIWGNAQHPKKDRVRFPHIIWKRAEGAHCTTEVVPGAFTEGATEPHHFQQLTTATASALIMDSEVLHRGGAVPILGPYGSQWASSCSVELCSSSGWVAWEAGTEGTVADPNDEDWRMLEVARRKEAESDVYQAWAKEENQHLLTEASNEAALIEEQQVWESEQLRNGW